MHHCTLKEVCRPLTAFFLFCHTVLTSWRKTSNPYVENSTCRCFHIEHVVPLVNNVTQRVRSSHSSSAICERFWHPASIVKTPKECSSLQGERCSPACQTPSGSWSLPFNLLRSWVWQRKDIFGNEGHKKGNYKEDAVREVCHSPVSTYFSQRSHGGILEPTDCFFGCCVGVHVLAFSVSHAHTDTHTRTLSFESSKSPFTLQNTHTPCPVCLGALHQHTHSLLPMPSLRNTLHRGPPLPYCPSIWLVPFVQHILLAADGKLLRAGGAVGACPDLLKTYNMTWDLAF